MVVDATQLERHLKFASYVARQGKPFVIALTMMDLLAQSGQAINTTKLSAALGTTVVAVDGRTGWGVEELLTELRRAVADLYNDHNRLAMLNDDPVEAYREIERLLEAERGAQAWADAATGGGHFHGAP
jgi:Fe2+ transport system protein B